MQYLKTFLMTTIIFLLMDGLWLGYISKQFYIKEMGSFLRLNNGAITPNYGAAAVVYIALILGILVFVLPKAQGSIFLALIYGALYGFCCYATYDFTNLAVVKNWPVTLSIIDTVWGCVICGVTSAVVTWISKL